MAERAQAWRDWAGIGRQNLEFLLMTNAAKAPKKEKECRVCGGKMFHIIGCPEMGAPQ